MYKFSKVTAYNFKVKFEIYSFLKVQWTETNQKWLNAYKFYYYSKLFGNTFWIQINNGMETSKFHWFVNNLDKKMPKTNLLTEDVDMCIRIL